MSRRFIDVSVSTKVGDLKHTISKRAITSYNECASGKTFIKADGERYFVNESYDTIKAMINDDVDPLDWSIVSASGNPSKPGVYETVLIFEAYKDGKAANEKFATVEKRLYAAADEIEKNWAMEDQDTSADAYWVQESGSYYGETVYAWRPVGKPRMPELPEGVQVYEGE